MNGDADFRKTVHIKSPLEKIIEKLKELDNAIKKSETYPTDSAEVIIRLVQKVAEELEKERGHAVLQMVNSVTRMEDLQFQRGRLYQIKRLQRDFSRE